MTTSNDDAKSRNRDHTNLPMIMKPELNIDDDFLKILRDNAFNGMGRASKFENYWEIDKNTKSRLCEFYVKGDAQDAKEIYDFVESNRDYSSIPILARYDISNPDKLCKSEEFTVMRYLIGSNEEIVAVSVEPYQILIFHIHKTYLHLKSEDERHNHLRDSLLTPIHVVNARRLGQSNVHPINNI
ncbi:hypothetical protein Tco_0200862 [Tanacetum coccineum]